MPNLIEELNERATNEVDGETGDESWETVSEGERDDESNSSTTQASADGGGEAKHSEDETRHVDSP